MMVYKREDLYRTNNHWKLPPMNVTMEIRLGVLAGVQYLLGEELNMNYLNTGYSNLLWNLMSQSPSVQSHSCVQLFTTPWTAARQASLSITNFQSLLKLMCIESVMRPTISSSVIPFSSCPQSFPASGSFPMSWAFRIRWPKHWSFSFSISPSNGYSGLISFKMDWLDVLVVQGTLKNPL